jgi:hypothetical protein
MGLWTGLEGTRFALFPGRRKYIGSSCLCTILKIKKKTGTLERGSGLFWLAPVQKIVQKIYGDAAHHNFEIEKKAYKGAPIGRTSGQISRTEPIPMVGNDF